MNATTFSIHADAAAVRRLQVLANLLDSSCRIPGTNIRFGLDPLLGLIPIWGDLIAAAISSYIVLEAARMGASNRTLALMVLNILLDLVIGEFPVLGDIFDVAFKANQRNLRLLGIEPLRV